MIFPRKYDIALDRETLRNYISFGGKAAVWTREPNGSAQNQVHEMKSGPWNEKVCSTSIIRV